MEKAGSSASTESLSCVALRECGRNRNYQPKEEKKKGNILKKKSVDPFFYKSISIIPSHNLFFFWIFGGFSFLCGCGYRAGISEISPRPTIHEHKIIYFNSPNGLHYYSPLLDFKRTRLTYILFFLWWDGKFWNTRHVTKIFFFQKR